MVFNSKEVERLQSEIARLETKVSKLEDQIKILNQNNFEAQKKIDQKKFAIELVLKWADNVDESINSTQKLLERLSKDDCSKIFKQEPLDLPPTHKELIERCLNNVSMDKDDLEEDKNDKGELIRLRLSPKLVTHIRWKGTSYLNLLEAIMTAWKYEIADRKIIEEEFAYLISEKDTCKYYALDSYREACGGAKVYPAIEEFVNAVKKGSQDKIIKYIEDTLLKIQQEKSLSLDEAQNQTAQSLVNQVNADPKKKIELIETVSKAMTESVVSEAAKAVLNLALKSLSLLH